MALLPAGTPGGFRVGLAPAEGQIAVLPHAVAVAANVHDVAVVAQADREALEHTLRAGEMPYRSRSRGLWHKSGTSGNVQCVLSLTADCDRDAVRAVLAARAG